MSAAAERLFTMLVQRGPHRTLCPSEVARALAGPDGDWRDRMAEVHAAVDESLSARTIALRWKNQTLARREGPYRIGLPE